jgi:hypothetical protein
MTTPATPSSSPNSESISFLLLNMKVFSCGAQML